MKLLLEFRSHLGPGITMLIHQKLREVSNSFFPCSNLINRLNDSKSFTTTNISPSQLS